MWCKDLRRLPNVIGIKSPIHLSKAPVVRSCGCTRSIHIAGGTTGDSTGSQGQGQTYQQWSRKHLAAVLAGVGLSVVTYKRWAHSHSLHAKEPETSTETSAESATSQQDDKSKDIDWSTVPEIPSHVPYLLVGGGIASLEAFIAIKTKDVNAKVLMITEEPYPPYIRPPLSKQFWHDEDVDAYKDFKYTTASGKKISVFRYEGLYMEPKKLPYSDRGGLALLKGRKVAKLDSANKKVELEDGTQIGFDKCLIATGGKPKNHPLLERAGQDVKDRTVLYRNLSDLWRLSEVTKTAKSVAVIGGGFLGSELAIGLANRGKSTGMTVHQIYPEKGNMAKVLPEFLSQWTSKKVEDRNVQVIPNTAITSAVYEDGKVKLGLSKGQYVSVDCVVVAVGLDPNTDLAASGHLELDTTHGGYLVNTNLQARDDIWAAGDCACFYDSKLGRRRVEHYEHAELTGRQAGFNMAGDSQPYTYQSSFWCILGSGISYEAVGLIDSSLQTYSVFRKKGKKKAKTDDPKSTNSDVKTDTDQSTSKNAATDEEDEYLKGVIFYIKDDVVVGVVLWNLDGFTGEPTRLEIGRQVIQDGAKGKDLTEVAKLFNIYSK